MTPEPVQHAFTGPDHAEGACARCSRPVRRTRAGRPHAVARYCSSSCKAAATRDRRAAARRDLLDAIDQLRVIEHRVQNALAVLGLNPRGRR